MFELDPIETRILGCLLEKQRTTPDAYPLTLNSLRLACNQSTNRDPVMDIAETDIQEALQRLHRRELTRVASGHGSRSSKYRHLLTETLGLPEDQSALLCVLLLRGDQTPGELKQRCERMHAFADLAEVDAALDGLVERGLAERLERRPGEKQIRCRQLMSGESEESAGDVGHGAEPAFELKKPPQIASLEAQAGNGVAHEIAELRAALGSLQREVAQLRARIDEDDEAVDAG